MAVTSFAVANFAYPAAAANVADNTADLAGAAAMPLSLALFADRAHVRDRLHEDALRAGFRVTQSAGLDSLVTGVDAPDARPLAEVVLVDCPAVDAAALAALARLDVRARQAGAHLIVATTVAALEDVFGCLDQSRPQLLVDPTAADMALALGRALALAPGHALRELAAEDRLQLLRLTEQVGRLAARLDGLGQDRDGAGPAGVKAPAIAFHGAPADDGTAHLGAAHPRMADAGLFGAAPAPALPDPRLLRQLIRQRQQRARFFDADLFADPAWDMLLDLAAARAEGQQVSVTSLCIAAGVPPTTALRWIGQMVHAGLFERVEDTQDRRRAFIRLADSAAHAMARYFAAVGFGTGAALLI